MHVGLTFLLVVSVLGVILAVMVVTIRGPVPEYWVRHVQMRDDATGWVRRKRVRLRLFFARAECIGAVGTTCRSPGPVRSVMDRGSEWAAV
jgi:hypothetical protein